MSSDMSTPLCPKTMTERKQQILQTAIELVAEEGYGNLSMRALARASNMKLGALQYHFRTWETLLRALVDYAALRASHADDLARHLDIDPEKALTGE